MSYSNRTLLIDADVLVYQSSFGAQKTRYTVNHPDHNERVFENAKDRDAWLKEVGLTKDDVVVDKFLDVLEENIALKIAERNLDAILAEIPHKHHELYLTGKGNYREKVATTKPYKGNRDDIPKPVHYAAVKQWYIERGACIIEGQEADDELGIRATTLGNEGVICTIDKDLNQVPGLHYDWGKAIKFKVDKVSGHKLFCAQLLTGDTTDNIPGLAGYGPAKARKILDGLTNPLEMIDAVCKEYTEQGHDLAYLNEQGVLLWIRRLRDENWSLAYYKELLNDYL